MSFPISQIPPKNVYKEMAENAVNLALALLSKQDNNNALSFKPALIPHHTIKNITIWRLLIAFERALVYINFANFIKQNYFQS